MRNSSLSFRLPVMSCSMIVPTMSIKTAILMICTAASLFFTSSSQTCQDYKFSTSIDFNSCIKLPVLDAHLHWTYNPSDGTVHIAYRAKQTPSGWIAWGINPSDTGMIGTQALVAFQDFRGNMRAYTTNISSYSSSMRPGPLSFSVKDLCAEYSEDEMIIFAVLGPLNNGTSFNIVWQAGDLVINGIPMPHPYLGPHLKSFGTLDFVSG